MSHHVESRSGGGSPSPKGLGTVELADFIEIAGAAPEIGARAPGAGLPRHATKLLDREPEIARLCALIRDPARRLITITGPGGVGKTRLAQEVARLVAEDFPDGAVYISLAAVRDPAHVMPALARGIGLRVSGRAKVLEAISIGLHAQHILLILDNFEQVIDAASDVAQLTAECPLLKLLVTSRKPLHVSEEVVFLTGPLSVGSDGSMPMRDGVPLPGAVQLFAERAQQANPEFQLTQRNEAVVREICRRLDGLPLAIELAAARMASVSPSELLDRLDPRLPLLANGHRDLPERQQTMRSAIGWSYELLNEADQQLFRWLSVFVGGFRLSAAEAVTMAMQSQQSPPPPNSRSVIDGISALMACNLLHRVPGDNREYRYAMLEVVREYGLELLQSRGELSTAQSAHVAYYASIREWLDPNRFRPGERLIDHLWDIDAEHPNLRAALATCEASGDALNMLEIAGALAVFWHHRGFLGEGRAWLERALDVAINAPAESRGWGLAGLGLVCWTQSDYASAEPVLLEALELARELDHAELQALSFHVLALIDLEQGNHVRGRERIEEALKLWKQLELLSDEAMVLHIHSFLPPRPGQPDERLSDALRCLSIFESIGHMGGVGFAHFRIGNLAELTGDQRRAFSHFIQALDAWLDIDERWAINRLLITLAELALRHRQLDASATFIGVVEARMRLSDAGLWTESRRVYTHVCASLESALGPARLESGRRAGAKLDAQEIKDLARTLGSKIFERSLLTQREVDVLRRVASGETDREIAEALFLSPRTVHSHVGHILAKLDVTSRREAVRRATGLGLLGSNPFDQ